MNRPAYLVFFIFLYLFMPSVLSLFMSRRKRREPSLKTILRKVLHCSGRQIFIGDRHSDPVTDKAMREFIAQRTGGPPHLEGEIEDCEDDALAFHKDAKDWFRAKGINAQVGEIWCYPSKEIVAHAFDLSVKPDNTVSFWGGKSGRRRSLNARVQLVVI